MPPGRPQLDCIRSLMKRQLHLDTGILDVLPSVGREASVLLHSLADGSGALTLLLRLRRVQCLGSILFLQARQGYSETVQQLCGDLVPGRHSACMLGSWGKRLGACGSRTGTAADSCRSIQVPSCVNRACSHPVGPRHESGAAHLLAALPVALAGSSCGILLVRLVLAARCSALGASACLRLALIILIVRPCQLPSTCLQREVSVASWCELCSLTRAKWQLAALLPLCLPDGCEAICIVHTSRLKNALSQAWRAARARPHAAAGLRLLTVQPLVGQAPEH